MEQKIQVAKDERKEKKRGGIFGWLRGLGKSGGGASGMSGAGFGGLGGGLADAGFAGGLLATKAGLIGLIMIGSTLAGGLGVLGYRFFGPGADGGSRGGFQLFEPKPPSASNDAGAPRDGNSQSLSLFAAGNAAPPLKEPAKADVSATAAAASADKSAVGAGHAINANVGGNKAVGLKSDRKFGDLSKLGGAGAAGGTSATMGSALNHAHAAPGTSKGLAKPSASSVGRGIGRRLGGSNSLQQLGQVRRDQRAAPSSSSAGATYDGARPAGITGADAAAPAQAGTSDGAGSRPNPTNGSDSGNRFPPAPAAEHTNVTPWQGAINTAMMCIVGAAALLFAASKVKKAPGYGTALAAVLCGIAAMLALMAIALGSMMAGGKYGQKFQGNMFVLSGGLMLATAAMGFFPGPSDANKDAFDPTMIMMVSGGAALAAAMVGYISKPMKLDSSFFPDGKAPDWR
jgi:hypothetical protein